MESDASRVRQGVGSVIVQDFTVAYYFERLAKSRQHGQQLADRVGARTETLASETSQMRCRLEARTVVLPRPALPQPAIQRAAQGSLTWTRDARQFCRQNWGSGR